MSGVGAHGAPSLPTKVMVAVAVSMSCSSSPVTSRSRRRAEAEMSAEVELSAGVGASARRIDEDAALRAIVEGTASETGQAFYRALVRNLAAALDTYGAWLTEYDERQNRLRALAFWLGDRF